MIVITIFTMNKRFNAQAIERKQHASCLVIINSSHRLLWDRYFKLHFYFFFFGFCSCVAHKRTHCVLVVVVKCYLIVVVHLNATKNENLLYVRSVFIVDFSTRIIHVTSFFMDQVLFSLSPYVCVCELNDRVNDSFFLPKSRIYRQKLLLQLSHTSTSSCRARNIM